MRLRRPDSLNEASVTVKRVRIDRSIWCRTLPPNRGGGSAARRGEPAVLLTAFAVQIIHRYTSKMLHEDAAASIKGTEPVTCSPIDARAGEHLARLSPSRPR